MQSIHQFKFNDLYGNEVDFEQYKGKVLLIVNTASKCGFTPQLEGLEAMYQKYKDRGLEVLAFPSDQFGGQEPLEGTAIGEFCEKNYGVNFTIMEKSEVKGSNPNPVFQFLSNKSENGKINTKPKWNFFKYVVDKEGNVVDYFMSLTKPEGKKITRLIESLLD